MDYKDLTKEDIEKSINDFIDKKKVETGEDYDPFVKYLGNGMYRLPLFDGKVVTTNRSGLEQFDKVVKEQFAKLKNKR